MKDLLKLEFRKLKRQKSFYIILAIMVALVVISALTYKLMESIANEVEEMGEVMGQSLSISGTGLLLGFASAANFGLLTAIFVAIVVCDDFDSKIIKNIFSRGYSRSDFFAAKFIYVIITTSIMFILAVTSSGICGALLFKIDGDIGKMVMLIAVQYLACMAGVAMFFAVSVMIKKLGGTIAINIIASTVIELILSLVTSLLKIEDFSLSEGWFSSFTSSLSRLDVSDGRIIFCAVASVVYIALFSVVGYFVSEKTEI